MSRALVIIAFLLACPFFAMGQPMLPPDPASMQGVPLPAPTQSAPPAPIGQVYAVLASGGVPQSLNIDEKLKGIAAIFNDLPYTEYEAIAINSQEMPWGEEVLFPINALHAFKTTALSMDAEGGIVLHARVERLQGEDYVNALDTQAVAAQGQALVFRGIPAGQGELILVMLVRVPGDGDGGGESEEQQPPDSDDENQEQEEQQQQADTDESEDDHGDDTEENSVNSDAATEGEVPVGDENLEALLNSLDDIDRREQVEELKQRDRIDFKGDWW
ncbi:MAG: hypothetical protein GX117_03130 [Candidatus Hydrogenedentes bacterium]|jgi:hypothetical protein|nr:hypothetical protein [Candidatus Hydrogenedentota bacterium]